MRNKLLPILTLIVVIAGAIGLRSGNNNDLAPYTPRTNGESSSNTGDGYDASIRGAIDYYTTVRSNQVTGTVNSEDYFASVEQANLVAKKKMNLPLEWEELGPDNVGGRARGFIIDKDDHNTLYIGAVSGGVWKSTSAGQSWTQLTADLDNQIVSCLAQTNDGAIYFGTGEQEFTRGSNGNENSGFAGAGVYKSTDGNTFTKLPSTDPSLAGNANWDNTNYLFAHPTLNRLYAGNETGLFYTDDGGGSWTRVQGINNTQACKEVKVADDGTVLAVIGRFLYKSTDGTSFSQVGQSVISNLNSRLTISFAPSDPNFAYCVAAATGSNRLLAVYQSTDKGDTWSVIGNGSTNSFDPLGSAVQGQGDYNNVVAVDPENPERIFVGGVTMWGWTPEGGWVQISSTFDSPFNRIYIHPDLHGIDFDTKADPYRMYIVNDGGVYVSIDKAQTFFPVNRSFNATQFYAFDADQSGRILGGTQDNGTQFITRTGNTTQSAFQVFGGDGFHAEISDLFPNVIFAGSQYGNYARSQNNGQSFDPFFDENTEGLSGQNNAAPFNTPILLHENMDDSTGRMAMGVSGSVWIADDVLNFSKTPFWFRAANITGTAQCLQFTPSGDALYVGTSGGRVYRISGILGAKYDTSLVVTNPDSIGFKSEIIPVPGTASRAITGIAIDPNDTNHVVVTAGNYGNTNYVFRSTNAAEDAANVVFTSIQNNLPRMPVYDAAISAHNDNYIILATEFGMWASDDAGATWSEQNNGMERVPTFMIRQYVWDPAQGPEFYIATHGRGFFRTRTLGTVGIKENLVGSAKDKKALKTYPNPATNFTNIEFDLKNNDAVSIVIVDINGREVYNEVIDNGIIGLNTIRVNTSAFENGTYFARLDAGKQSEYTKFIVLK